jgi:hypothetical protein
MEKVLDVYKRPYSEDHPVVCMDESPKQLISSTRPGRMVQPGKEATVDCDYIRHGMCNVFIANEPLRGKRYVEIKEQKTKIDWAHFVKRIADEWYAHCGKITLVMDNLKTHSTSSFYEAFEPQEAKRILDRFEFVYTPKHGSWLNMAEIELNVLNGQCLNRHIETMKDVQKEAIAWQNHRNNKKSGISWHFTTKEARIKLKKLYPSIQD